MSHEVGPLTWRRFVSLLGGLSMHSRWATWVAHNGTTITDPKAAERAVFNAIGV